MIIRGLLIALIALGLGGFGTIAWVILPQSAAEAAAPVAKKVAVITVTRSLRPGALLKPEDLLSVEVIEERLPPGYVEFDADAKRALVGGLVRRPLSPGDVLRLPGDALRPSDHGFLTAVLTPGSRAVTVGVDSVTGAAGLLWPGDRVDMILTQTIDDANIIMGRRIAAETVLRDVRVIAIDQQIGQAGASGPGDGIGIAKTVTIEVTPAKAELVQVATKLGRISLALRSAEAGPNEEQVPSTTWAGDVSQALPSAPVRTPTTTIKVFQGQAEARDYRF